jgi:hypothetical protein
MAIVNSWCYEYRPVFSIYDPVYVLANMFGSGLAAQGCVAVAVSKNDMLVL